ncbi:MAG: flavodoxin domain-containing protein [Thermoplasmata archaeon]|nr:flavodoxin domain-containing protein [Thermoplasmata archaeon]
MRIEYYHASEYGNGAQVAEEFKRVMATLGASVSVHHVRDVKPMELPPADLYLFSSPGRFGKPIGDMRRFLKKLNLPSGARYALLVTELNPVADKKTEKGPSEDELGKCQQIIPRMDEALQAKGLSKVVDGKIYVTGMKGPLESGWQGKVMDFAQTVLRQTSCP